MAESLGSIKIFINASPSQGSNDEPPVDNFSEPVPLQPEPHDIPDDVLSPNVPLSTDNPLDDSLTQISNLILSLTKSKEHYVQFMVNDRFKRQQNEKIIAGEQEKIRSLEAELKLAQESHSSSLLEYNNIKDGLFRIGSQLQVKIKEVTDLKKDREEKLQLKVQVEELERLLHTKVEESLSMSKRFHTVSIERDHFLNKTKVLETRQQTLEQDLMRSLSITNSKPLTDSPYYPTNPFSVNPKPGNPMGYSYPVNPSQPVGYSPVLNPHTLPTIPPLMPNNPIPHPHINNPVLPTNPILLPNNPVLPTNPVLIPNNPIPHPIINNPQRPTTPLPLPSTPITNPGVPTNPGPYTHVDDFHIPKTGDSGLPKDIEQDDIEMLRSMGFNLSDDKEKQRVFKLIRKHKDISKVIEELLRAT